MPRDSSETRRRIIAAADDLFYGEGIRSVGVDAIAERSGVTKKTLYYHFPSKDQLIAAYLEARDLPTLERYRHWFGETEGPLAAQVAGMFHRLAAWAQNPRWKGCGFARAAAELAGTPGHPALAVAGRHKKALEAWLAGLLAAEGLSRPDLLARQLMVLLDGAITAVLIHRDPGYAEAAGEAALRLIETAAARAAAPAGLSPPAAG